MSSAEDARDEALNRVANNAGSFVDMALAAIGQRPVGKTATGEDIRLALMDEGIVPHHHNAWGALINVAVKRKLLTPTGRRFKMRTTRSHARNTPEYVRT